MPLAAIPTMTPADEAAWVDSLRRGTLFPSQRTWRTNMDGTPMLVAAYVPLPMICQQCSRVFEWGEDSQRKYWRRTASRGRGGPPCCSTPCARRQTTRAQMRGYTAPRYAPLHVIADLAYAATHAN